MARRRREVSSAETTEFASPDPLDGLLEPAAEVPRSPLSSLDNFLGPSIPADRRVFSFGEPERFNLNVGSSVDGIRDVGVSRLSTQVGFSRPAEVGICVRRKERREVLHAKRRIRKGRGGGRRQHWYSKIKC